MSTWTETDPGAGDAGLIRTQAAALDGLVSTVVSVRELAQTAVAGTGTDVWAGQAGDAWRSGAADVLSHVQQLAQQLLDLATALHVHAGEVDDIARRALPHRNTLSDTERFAGLLRPSGRGVLNPAGSDAAALLLTQQTEWDRTTARRSAAEGQLRSLAAERLASDRRVVLALQPVQVADWTMIASVLAGAGIHAPAQVDAESVVGAWVAWTEKALADGRLTDAEVERLNRFFTDFGGDERVMSRYFRELGGAATATLVDALGNGVHAGRLDVETALALAISVQKGLSVGSAGWTAEQARRFAHALASGPHGVGAVGFLFGDANGAPMGRELAVAMADLVDDRERLGGDAWRIPATAAGGGLALADLQFPDKAGRASDPAGIVLQTLGQHPDAAVAWLTDTAHGGGRVSYWFGTRDWSGLEGFEGPAALWAGVQRATGGPGDAETFDLAVWEVLAQLNVDIAVALTGNGSFSATAVSDAAADELALVIAANLPLWLEVPIVSEMGDSDLNGPVPVDFHWLGVSLPVPAVSNTILQILLGIGGRTDLGRDRIGAAINTTTARLLTAVDTNPDAFSLADGLKRIALLYGASQGAVAGHDMVVGAHHDAHLRTAIDVLSVGLSALPVPRDLPGSAKAWEVFADGLMHIGGTHVEQLVARNYQTAVDAFWADAAGRQNHIREILSAAAEHRTSLTGVELDRFIGWFVRDYANARGNTVLGSLLGGS